VPPPDLSASAEAPIDLPSAEAHGRGAALPDDRTKKKPRQTPEERRFNRFDRNRDGRITRVEMLSTRVKVFQKLDTNHDNLLTFEEWAVKTSERFKTIDRDGDGVVSRQELDAFYTAQQAAKVRIPTIPPTHSDLKPPTIPSNSRPGYEPDRGVLSLQ
jgi:hypothetical protein